MSVLEKIMFFQKLSGSTLISKIIYEIDTIIMYSVFVLFVSRSVFKSLELNYICKYVRDTDKNIAFLHYIKQSSIYALVFASAFNLVGFFILAFGGKEEIWLVYFPFLFINLFFATVFFGLLYLLFDERSLTIFSMVMSVFIMLLFDFDDEFLGLHSGFGIGVRIVIIGIILLVSKKLYNGREFL